MVLPRVARPVVLAFVVTLGLAGCGDDSQPQTGVPTSTPSTAPDQATTVAAPAPSTTTVGRVVQHAFRGGEVTGNAREQVNRGETVRLVVASDVAEEVHVHGYDKRVAVPANGTAELTFTADIPGVFEVELEQRHRRLFTLEVR
jgi:hypothetical protein